MKHRTKKNFSEVYQRLRSGFFSFLIKRFQSGIPPEYNLSVKQYLPLIDLGKKPGVSNEKPYSIDSKIDPHKKVTIKLRLNFIAPAKGLARLNELFTDHLIINKL